MSDFRSYAADEVLRDGGSIHIRAIRPDDKQRLLDHFNRLSPRSVHFRFFGAKRRLTNEELVRFTELDFSRSVGLVAILRQDGEERIIGVGRYIATGEHVAEVAFAVADEHQGRGIGTVLLEHLAPIARRNGVTELEADVLGENNQMLVVFRKSGFVVRRSIEAGVVHLSFPTAETEEFLQASLERDMSASAESVRHFLQPKSIAVIGAGAERGSAGRAVVANLIRHGFTGRLYPIDPSQPTVEGLPAFADLGAIGAPVELAVIAVPAAEVPDAVRDCAAAAVRAAVVLSPGFADASAEGSEAQRDLVRLARQSGLRVLGPNSLGVLNTDPAVRLHAVSSASATEAGNVAMLVQSRGLGGVMLDCASARCLGISSFASAGDKADVSSNDLLSFWLDDPRTAVVALYLESFGNPRRFARIAPRVARAKPIVVLKAGRVQAVASGDAERWTGTDRAVDALFEQAGVIRTETIEELFDVVALLSSQPLPGGPRVGVVANASGPGVLLADAFAARSLVVASLQASTMAALGDLLGPQRSAAHPLDLGEAAMAAEYEQAMRLLGADAGVDAVIVMHIPTDPAAAEEIAAAVARGAGGVPPEKPVLMVSISATPSPELLHRGPRGRLPAYGFPENAARALSAAERHGRWRRRPLGTTFELDRVAVGTIRAVVDRVRAVGEGPRVLEPRDFAMVLRAAGIAVAESHLVAPEEAAEFAETLGYPLAVKAVSAGLVQRGDAGCVGLGLDDEQAVNAAVESLRRRLTELGLRLEAVQLQREYGGGIEAIVGVSSDPLFGPLIVCGLGGVLVEVVRDLAVRLSPLTDVDAAAMLDGLRSARLLRGYRGVGPGDRAALESLLVRLSAVVEAIPEIEEMELRPVKVLAPGQGTVVLDGRLVIGRG